MSTFLFAASVGPVQDFIKAARKTRDLWFGSQMLSEISRAVAASLNQQNVKLIFPHADLLEVKDANIANVILCTVEQNGSIDAPETQAVLKGLATASRKAAQQGWIAYVDEARRWIDRRLRNGNAGQFQEDIWNEQVGDVVEFYAAWVPCDHSEKDGYKTARRRLMQLLAGRKQCRAFKPAPDHPGVPKSSLDGARESVLKDPSDETRSRLRLRKGELLDAVGMTKRLARGDRRRAMDEGESGSTGTRDDKEDKYPSVSRVAAESWLAGAQVVARDELKELKSLCDGTQVIHGIPARLAGAFEVFPHEGAVLYRNRHREFFEESQPDEVFQGKKLDIVRLLKHMEGKIGGEPDPYVAVLLADGDRVGKILSTIANPEAHEHFSEELSDFAVRVKQIIEGEFRGVLIYSGGDDVLALMPVHQSVECARRLRDLFDECMIKALPHLNVAADRPTLSVGIAIGHFMEPLEFLLDHARAAEKDAKENKSGKRSSGDDKIAQAKRNALAVHVHTRGGSPIRFREQWNESRTEMSFDQRLLQWVELLMSDRLPHRAAYELRRLAEDFDHDAMSPALAEGMRQEAERLLLRKRAAGGDSGQTKVAELLQGVEDADDLKNVAAELLIARRLYLARRLTQPRGANTPQEEDA